MADPLHELQPVAILQVGSSSAAISTRVVERLAVLGAVMRVPLAPEPLSGVAVIGGEPVPVVDLAVAMGGMRPRAPGGETAIVCRTFRGTVALVGGKVRWVGRLRRSPHRVDSPVAAEGVEWRGMTVPVVDLERVLGSLRGAGAPARRIADVQRSR